MALKSTIHKAELSVSDIDRGHYANHTLTIARHPSETEERMMVRVIAFALHADEQLAFGGGVSTDDEPALWRKDLTGSVEEWIEVGLPEERRVRRASGVADRVFVYTYGGRGADLWWKQNATELARLANLTVVNLPYESTQALAKLAQRNMKLDCTIQEGQVWLSDGAESVAVEPQVWQVVAPARR